MSHDESKSAGAPIKAAAVLYLGRRGATRPALPGPVLQVKEAR
jgi:hypothetical protein